MSPETRKKVRLSGNMLEIKTEIKITRSSFLRSEGQIVPGKAAIMRGTIISEVLLAIRVVVSTTRKLGS